MAASISQIPPAQYCRNCRGWPDHSQDFQKIIDLTNVGVVIYLHTTKIAVNERGLADNTVKIIKEIFVLHNTKDVKISTADIVSDLEKQIMTCSRCLKIVERALTLLRNVPNINKKEVRGVCDHCLTKQKHCCHCDNVKRKFMTISKVKPTISKQFIRFSDSEESYVSKMHISMDKKPERREFSAPLFPEKPVLFKYAKETLLKIGKEKAQDAAEFLRFYSDTEIKDIEDLLNKIASTQAPKAMPEPTAVRFRHSMESIVFDDHVKTEGLLEERNLKEKQALSFAEHYQKKYYDVEDIVKRGHFEGIDFREQKTDRDRYFDDNGFDGKRRINKSAPREQKYRDRYTDEEDLDRKRQIDEKAPREQQFRDRYTDGDAFDRKRRTDERAPKEQRQYKDGYTDDNEFDRKQRTDKRAPRTQNYKDQYTDGKDFDRKRHIDERIPREHEYKDRYTNEDDFDRKQHIDKKAPREQQYRDRHTDEDDINKKRRLSESDLKDMKSRYLGKKDIESKHRVDQPPLKAKLKTKIEPSTISQESLLKRSRFASKSGVTTKDFSFYFPKGKKKLKSSKGNVSSSVIIKDTREKLQEKEKKGQFKLQTEKRKIEKKMEHDEKEKIRKELPDEDKEENTKKKPFKREKDGYSELKETIKQKARKKLDIELLKDKKEEKPGKKDKDGKIKTFFKGKMEKGEEGVKSTKVGPEHQTGAKKFRSRKENQQKKKIYKDELGSPKTEKLDGTSKKESMPIDIDFLLGKTELPLKNITIVKSLDDIYLKLVKLRPPANIETVEEQYGKLVKALYKKILPSDEDILKCERKDEIISDIIIGSKICKRTTSHTKIKDETGVIPLVFRSTYDTEQNNDIQQLATIDNAAAEENDGIQQPTKNNAAPVNNSQNGIIRYALSDRSFIEKGWTVLPTERIVKKTNVYRMRPSKPEFDWFKHNKNKQLMNYDTGEKLADFDENGRGRWYYKNGRVALDYYEPEETNTQQRFIIYSSGEPDDRGHAQPYTVLAVFDYLGNGIVYDHTGKIRLKYNQTEGVLLDQNVGPESRWKWHTLNDPPDIQQVIVDTQMPYKDTEILKLGLKTEEDEPVHENDEEMLTIEFENYVKEKSMKLGRSFKPFQIRMKALKINKHFSLKVLDQATIYIIYRDGSTNLKLNIGMMLDHKEIIDTDVADLGVVYHSLEKFPAKTDSLARIQKTIRHSQHFEKMRLEHDKHFKIPENIASVDKLTAAASRPMRRPLRTVPSCSANCFPLMTSNVY